MNASQDNKMDEEILKPKSEVWRHKIPNHGPVLTTILEIISGNQWNEDRDGKKVLNLEQKVAARLVGVEEYPVLTKRSWQTTGKVFTTKP